MSGTLRTNDIALLASLKEVEMKPIEEITQARRKAKSAAFKLAYLS
jgi:hypothetical protein